MLAVDHSGPTEIEAGPHDVSSDLGANQPLDMRGLDPQQPVRVRKVATEVVQRLTEVGPGLRLGRIGPELVSELPRGTGLS